IGLMVALDDCRLNGQLPINQPSALSNQQSALWSMTALRTAVALLVVIAALATPACRREEVAAAKSEPQIVWRSVGKWSGRGNRQTESFTSDTGALRVRWETRPTSPATHDETFLLTAHSAISGRILQQVVDHPGAGSGVDYVSQDPHVFYMSVESAGL